MDQDHEQIVPLKALPMPPSFPPPYSQITPSRGANGQIQRVSFGIEYRRRYTSNASLNSQGQIVMRPNGVKCCGQNCSWRNICVGLLILVLLLLIIIVAYFVALLIFNVKLLDIFGLVGNEDERKGVWGNWQRPATVKTQLLEASKTGNARKVRSLLEDGVDVNSADEYGFTALHFAAQFGQIEIVNILLRQKSINVDCRINANITRNVKIKIGLSTPLHFAADGKDKIVDALLKNNAQADLKNEINWTPLIIASKAGKLAIVNSIMAKKPNTNAADSGGKTALHYAAIGGHSSVVFRLLNDSTTIVDPLGEDGTTPLHVAALFGNQETVKILLERNASVTLRSKNAMTSLHFASYGHYDMDYIVLMLIEHGSDIEATNVHGATPLYLTTVHSKIRSAELLLKHGANVNATAIEDNVKFAVIHKAAIGGSIEMVKLLLRYKADIESKNEFGSTPLHYATSSGNIGLVRFLINNNANVSALRKLKATETKMSLTPLHLASAFYHKPELIEILLDANASIEARDLHQRTPLHVAIIHQNERVVEKLVERGANVSAKTLSTRESEYITPMITVLHLAVNFGSSVHIIRLLYDKGADIEAEEKLGMTPLVVAVIIGRKDAVEFFLEKKANVHVKFGTNKMSILHMAAIYTQVNNTHIAEIAEMLLENNAELEAINGDGSRPSHFAALYGINGVLKVFIKFGVNLHAKDHDIDLTPIMFAAIGKRVETIRILLEHDSSLVHDKDNNEQTPLHHAIISGCLECVQILLEYNAPVNEADIDGKTAFDLAKQTRDSEILALLAKRNEK